MVVIHRKKQVVCVHFFIKRVKKELRERTWVYAFGVHGMGDTSHKIEPRLSLVGRGLSATPEKIRSVQRAVVSFFKASPKRSFQEVMRASQETDTEGTAVVSAEPLSAPHPRPSFTHPSQRDTYGREEHSHEKVVLKG
jgi:hypothetical protein